MQLISGRRYHSIHEHVYILHTQLDVLDIVVMASRLAAAVSSPNRKTHVTHLNLLHTRLLQVSKYEAGGKGRKGLCSSPICEVVPAADCGSS